MVMPSWPLANDGSRNQVPFFVEMDGNDRLNVQNGLNVIMRPGIEVEVELERHTDEVGHRVFHHLGKIRFVFRGLQGRRYQYRHHKQQGWDEMLLHACIFPLFVF
jgi:hypothetical protein